MQRGGGRGAPARRSGAASRQYDRDATVSAGRKRSVGGGAMARGAGARGARNNAKNLADTYLERNSVGGGSASSCASKNAERMRMIENELNLENVQHSASRDNSKRGTTSGTSPRSGKQLWNVVKKKPVTLSQKLRALENAIKVLQQQLHQITISLLTLMARIRCPLQKKLKTKGKTRKRFGTGQYG